MTDDRAHHAWDRARARREATSETAEYNSFSAFFDGWHAREDAASMRYPTDADIVDDMIAAAQVRAERSHQQSLDLMMRSRERERLIAAQRVALESQGKDPADAPLYRRISMQRNEIRRLTADNDRIYQLLEGAHHTLAELPANISDLLERRAEKEAPNAAEALRFMAKVIRDGTTLPEEMLGAPTPAPVEG